MVKPSRQGATARDTRAVAEGLVIRTESGFHRVLVDDHVVVCRAPRRLTYGERTTTTPVVIGDHVRIREGKDSTGIIEEVLPRENELVRGAAGGSRFLDVIAANIDLLVIVQSLANPEFNPARLDRFLLLAEAAEVPALIVLNKTDLVHPLAAQEVAELYRNAGYPVILSSAKTLDGVDELRAAITGKITAVVGPSGVGKSSLLNDIQPGLRLRTGEVSDATGKGRHTTTTAELLPLQGGGWVADTPGLRELSIREVAPEELEWLFPEFRPFLGRCRFSNCSHREEIDCAVKEAVEQGTIAPERYLSYRRVYDQLREDLPY